MDATGCTARHRHHHPLPHDGARAPAGAAIPACQDSLVPGARIGRATRCDAVDTFALLPLVEVAWADGTVDAAERQVIRRIVDHCAPSQAGVSLVEAWLGSPPDAELHAIWCSYVAALADTVDADLWTAWRRELLFAARDVAVAAVGPLAGDVSPAEAAVIRAAAAALPSRTGRPFAAPPTPRAGAAAPRGDRPCT